jgi:hypothetical protein
MEEKMKRLRYGLVVMSLLVCSATSAVAGVSIGIGLPNLSIGINLPLYPELVPVPGYPVYYAPSVAGNYFFYDGMYWVFLDDNWYASSWYNGPWALVEPEFVPVFILRIPVRYYQRPPVYFRGWQHNAPPRWGQHWGRGWEQRRRGWDRWNRSSAPERAPLPVYQRQYSGDRYPRVEQQHTLRSQSYRYQPRDRAIRQHFQQQGGQRPPAPVQRGGREEHPQMSPRQQDFQRTMPQQQGAPVDSRQPLPQRGGDNMQRPVQEHAPLQQRGPAMQEQRQYPGVVPREQAVPRAPGQGQRPQDMKEQQEPRGRGEGQRQEKDEEHGRGR